MSSSQHQATTTADDGDDALVLSQTTTIVRWLPLQGVCSSRRAAADLLGDGRVSVNDSVVTELGYPVASTDLIMVDNVLIPPQLTKEPSHVHIMMNKAPNTLCGLNNMRQLHGGGKEIDTRKTVHDGLQDQYPTVRCLGRLDVDTTGLLLFTSDGMLNHSLVHPLYHVPKVYQCTLRDRRSPLSQEAINVLQTGFSLPNGHYVCGKAWNHETDIGVVFLQITNGYQHQVKHMMRHVKRPLALLHRCTFAGLPLDETLDAGTWRHLTDEEVRELYELAQNRRKAVSLTNVPVSSPI